MFTSVDHDGAAVVEEPGDRVVRLQSSEACGLSPTRQRTDARPRFGDGLADAVARHLDGGEPEADLFADQSRQQGVITHVEYRAAVSRPASVRDMISASPPTKIAAVRPASIRVGRNPVRDPLDRFGMGRVGGARYSSVEKRVKTPWQKRFCTSVTSVCRVDDRLI